MGNEREIRRQVNNINHYTLVDKEYYDTLENYSSKDSLYHDVIMENLPQNWVVQGGGLWNYVKPPINFERVQGFKIHVSTIPNESVTLLNIVSDTLYSYETRFKYIKDLRLLLYNLGKNYSRSASGKFVTIYPKNLAEFKKLIEVLYNKTNQFNGPYILSDKQYRDSNILYYRYGGFKSIYSLNEYGEKTTNILDSESNNIPDKRVPYYQLQEWVKDPFGKEEQEILYKKDDHDDISEEEPNDPVIFKNRYKIIKPLKFSNTGGVYYGKDLQNKSEIIVKEARPHTSYNFTADISSMDKIENEFNLLKKLDSYEFIPKPIDKMKIWENKFIIMEFLKGTPLRSLRAQVSFNPLMKKPYTQDDVRQYSSQVINVGKKLVDIVHKVHNEDVIIGDVAADNFLYNKESKEIKLIDLEGGFVKGTKFQCLRISTRGYTKNRTKRKTIIDDYYSIGIILLSFIKPIQRFFILDENSAYKLLDYSANSKGISLTLCDLIRFLIDDNNRNKSEKFIYNESIKIINSFKPNKKSFSKNGNKTNVDVDSKLESLLQSRNSILDNIRDQATLKRHDRLFPADYRLFRSNPLSLAFGSFGVILALYNISGENCTDYIDWSLEKKIDPDNYTSGLYMGLAGISYALNETGYDDLAKEKMEMANVGIDKSKSSDLFFGVSGTGIINIYFYKRTNNKYFINNAISCYKTVINSLRKDDNNRLFYENINGTVFHGYDHGAAGIGLFLIKLYEITQDKNILKNAERLIGFEIDNATTREDKTLQWTYSKDSNTLSPYLRLGSSGIGAVLTQYYRVTNNEYYVQLLMKIANTLKHSDTVYPGLFSGMAGIGEFFMDVYNLLDKKDYYHTALDIAQKIQLYETKDQVGVRYPGDLIRYSSDLGTGSAGIALFYDRILHNNKRPIFSI